MIKKLTMSALALLLSVGVILCVFQLREIPVDNITPAEKLITKDHGLEKLLLAEAIFRVRTGFQDVTVKALAREVGLTLECKRQATPTQFYYVVEGNSYRCFVITDAEDVVQEVLVMRSFPTTAQTQDCIVQYSERDVQIHDIGEYDFYRLWRDIGYSSVHRDSQYILQDGVLVTQQFDEYSPLKHFFFTDGEWEAACEEWGGFVILPIDKQPW